MSDESIRDVILQLAIFVLICFAFLLAVRTYTDPGQFFMRYYAKDLGIIVETLHALPGDAEVTYAAIHPEHRYLFGFQVQGLYLAPAQDDPTEIAWRVRQGYGTATEPPYRSLQVHEVTLEAPLTISLEKSRTSITANEEQGACDGAKLLRKDLRLILDAPETALAKLHTFSLIDELEGNLHAPEKLHLRLLTGDQPSIAVTGKDGETAKLFACLLRERLRGDYPGLALSSSATGEATVVTLTLTPFKGGEETATATAIVLALKEAVR